VVVLRDQEEVVAEAVADHADRLNRTTGAIQGTIPGPTWRLFSLWPIRYRRLQPAPEAGSIMLNIVLLGAAVLLMRVGQVLYATGLCRSKNAAGTAVRVVADACVAVLCFWAVGAAILLQRSNGFFGVDTGLLFGRAGMGGGAFFYAAVVLVATGPVAGALAERSKFLVGLAASALLAGLVVPAAGRWVWGGWLAQGGCRDVAGAAPVHLVAGACAAVGALLVGPRSGKYNRDGSANMIPGHNIPLAAVGVMTMLVAWVPYVVGCAAISGAASTLLVEPVNVLLAAAAAGVAAIAVAQVRYGKPDVVLALTGVLGGLVAVAAAGGTVGTGSAVLIGGVAGVLVPMSAVALDLLAHLDDPTATVSVHGVGGLWGLVAAALFAPVGLLDRLKLLGIQLVAGLAVAALAGGASLLLLAALRATVGLRLREADEYDGIDLAEHDIGAYPDFQQTMIKSYHLREA
jgi:Amt family ammonium transporter